MIIFLQFDSSILTWLLEEKLLDVGVVEMLVPVVPLSSSEAELPAGDGEVCRGPVPGVGADRSPLALHQHLQHTSYLIARKTRSLAVNGEIFIPFPNFY